MLRYPVRRWLRLRVVGAKGQRRAPDSGVEPALLEVQLALERSHHIVVDRLIRAQAEERLAFGDDDGVKDFAISLSGLAGRSLAVEMLRVMRVGRAQSTE